MHVAISPILLMCGAMHLVEANASDNALLHAYAHAVGTWKALCSGMLSLSWGLDAYMADSLWLRSEASNDSVGSAVRRHGLSRMSMRRYMQLEQEAAGVRSSQVI